MSPKKYKYLQQYTKDFSPWCIECPKGTGEAYCIFCKRNLKPTRFSLARHARECEIHKKLMKEFLQNKSTSAPISDTENNAKKTCDDHAQLIDNIPINSGNADKKITGSCIDKKRNEMNELENVSYELMEDHFSTEDYTIKNIPIA